MNKPKWKVGIIVIVLAVGVIALWKSYFSNWFVEYPFPLAETHRLFDIGIVDANGDDFLDVYTSNHHFRQALLIGDAEGDFTDVLSEWGLDQSREFPLAELSFTPPFLRNLFTSNRLSMEMFEKGPPQFFSLYHRDPLLSVRWKCLSLLLYLELRENDA